MTEEYELVEYDRDEHREEVESLINGMLERFPLSKEDNRIVAEIAYAASELNLLPDAVVSISTEQVLMCWAMVELARRKAWDEGLNM